MRNAPCLKLEGGPEADGQSLLLDWNEAPIFRIAVLMAALVLPLGAIAARLVWLQVCLTDEFAAVWRATSVKEEAIACRDGRILSADGQVLAHDRIRYDLCAHYRWIENPPDDRWLKQQALARLSREDRRRPEKVEAAQRQVLQERNQMWERLSTALNRPQRELEDSRRAIQSRVESIVSSVTRRRDERAAAMKTAATFDTSLLREDFSPLNRDWWRRLEEEIVGQLTTPPERGRLDPIIVQEELTHHLIARDIGLRTVSAIETTPSRFPGLLIQTSSERVYPLRDVAGHLVGVRTERKPEDLDSVDSQTKGVTGTSSVRIGRDGVERSWDAALRGRSGTRKVVRTRSGDILSQTVTQPPVPGADVTLTIDLGLQRTAERLLDEAMDSPPLSDGEPPSTPTPQGGCIVIMDVRTGELLVAASAPRYDLELLTRPEAEAWRTAISDPRRPFFPRVTQMTVPPGSVFKIVTSIALLESGRMDPDEPLECQGYLTHPERNRCFVFRHYGVGHGDVTLADAIAQSCNVYFFHAAQRLGPRPIADWSRRLGLGVVTGCDIPGERAGHVPQTSSAGKVVGESWYPGSTLQLAIGQASLTVTPLQVVRMVSAVANGGILVTPHVVAEARQRQTDDDETSAGHIRLAGYEQERQPEVHRIPGLSPETLERVREAMRMVVEHPRGTGHRAAVEGIPIAGKTGTAEIGGGRPDHAWFVGFVPADSPRYAFTVVLEEGGSGGHTAALMARNMIEAMAEVGILRRRPTAVSPVE